MENFEMGGVENVTLRLISGLLRINPKFNITVLGLKLEGNLLSDYKKTCNTIEVSGSGFLDNCKSIRVHIGNLKPNVVFFTKGGLSRFSFLFNKPVKTFVIQHVPICLPQRNATFNFFRRIVATFLYRTLTGVVCVSDGIKDDLIEKKVISKNRVHRIYNPVLDKSILYKEIEPRIDYGEYFVCVGRLHFQKGYDLLIKVIQKCKEKDRNIKVVIIGDGPLRSSLETQIEVLGLADNLILHGEEVTPFPYIKKSKALLLTSRWEGLPTVLVEAMALGTQVISFDCLYGPKELTADGKYGFLVDFEDCYKFSQAMEEVVSSPKPLLNVNDFEIESSCFNYINLFGQEYNI